MAFSPDNIRRVREDFRVRRAEAAAAAEAAKTALYAEIPDLAPLDREISSVGVRVMRAAIAGGDAARNAGLMLSVLRGEERGAYRAAAIENAAAAIIAGEKAAGYEEALALASESVDSGRALAKLEALKEAAK